MKDFCAAVNNSKGKTITVDELRYMIPNDEKRFEIKFALMDVSLGDTDRNFTFNHKRRPFIILSKIPSQKIYRGIYTTSNLNDSLYSKTNLRKYKFVIGAEYDLPKKSLVEHRFYKTIPFGNLLQDYGMLSEEDTLKLIKYTCFSHLVKVNTNDNISMVEVGDVLDVNGKSYFIYKISNDKIYSVRIRKAKYNVYSQKLNCFHFGKDCYFIDYKDLIVLDNPSNLLLVDSFPMNVIETIQDKKYLKEKCRHK